MASSTFKRVDRRYFAAAVAHDLTHGQMDVYESGLEVTTEGTKDQRATALVQHLFDDIEDSDTAIIELLNHIYVESSQSSRWANDDGFKQLKAKVLDPRGVESGEDGFFIRNDSSMPVDRAGKTYTLHHVGDGSYANVFKYRDDDYLMPVAVKQALRSSTAVELQRFRAEFEVLKRLNHPYILTVYRYDESRHRYTMEYCDSTLGDFIARRNATLSFDTRKRIALQFLYGINYLTIKNILHRDLSLKNVLLKVHDEGALTVKLSDFGLHKTHDSNLTQTGTAIKGTLIDPMLADFKSYSLPNEIYAVGRLISYIFTGRQEPQLDLALGDVVKRCIDHDLSKRYATIPEIIQDIEGLVRPETPNNRRS